MSAEVGRMIPGRVLGARYRLVEPLAAGASGEVWRAVQIQLGREVAVKVLRTDLHPEARAQFEPRFMREAALAGRLQHPNVVTFHDYGVDADGTPFVVMELLRGRTLREAAELRAMPAGAAVRIIEGVARGLRHAHGQGMMHRDVKPSNIFLVRDEDGVEVPKLVDFGLVKEDDTEHTASGTFLGTPAFMSPEQARGLPVTDPRADIYSLGVVFYRLLSGVMPFTAESAAALAYKHIKEPCPSIFERAGLRVDPALEAIVLSCLEKEPERRPSAADLVDRLKSWRGELSSSGTVWPRAQIDDLPDEPEVSPARWLALGGLGVLGGGALACAGLGAVAFAWVWNTPVEAPPAPQVSVALGEIALSEPAEAPPPPAVEPAPDPAPPAPGPARAPAPARARAPAPAPAPTPEPPPAPPPPPAAPVEEPPSPFVHDGVRFADEAHMARAVAWLNTADATALEEAGVYTKGVAIVIKGRPWASIEAFAATPGVGEKTVLAASRASAPR